MTQNEIIAACRKAGVPARLHDAFTSWLPYVMRAHEELMTSTTGVVIAHDTQQQPTDEVYPEEPNDVAEDS